MSCVVDPTRNGTGQQQSLFTSSIPVGSAVSLTNNTAANITSIALPAGNFDVSGQVEFALGAATATTVFAGPSVVSATLPTQGGGAGIGTDALVTIPLNVTITSYTVTLGCIEISLSITAPTTVYLVALAQFTVGTVSVYGTLRARQTNS